MIRGRMPVAILLISDLQVLATLWLPNAWIRKIQIVLFNLFIFLILEWASPSQN